MISSEYLAGFFDGEGCINITVRGRCRQVALRVMIVNTDATILDEIRIQFGGFLNVPRQSKPNWKAFRQLTLVGKAAIDLLTAITPYLRIKKRQAELALEFWGFMQRPYRERNQGIKIANPSYGGPRFERKPATREKELWFKEQMHILNKKGA